MKLTEFPFRNTKFPKFPFQSHFLSLPSSSSSSSLKPSFVKPLSSSSLRSSRPETSFQDSNTNPSSSTSTSTSNSTSSSPWLKNWAPSTPPQHSDAGTRTTAIDRIVLRLRNLGLGSDDEDKEEKEDEFAANSVIMPLTGKEKLGDLLKRNWVRPDKMLTEDDEDDETVLPWERGPEEEEQRERGELKKRTVKAPTLAELTMEDTELRRLRRIGMTVRERISVPQAGITGPVLEKIHDHWRKSELVRLKFHEVLARDMKTAHEIVERRTGGLVVWRSGSVMMVYRGVNYAGPCSPPPQSIETFIPNVSSVTSSAITRNDGYASSLEKSPKPVSMTEEEVEFNSILDGLGPRFEDWWGTGILPVDADLLPQTIPGFKTPFRLLPTGMRSRLTNAEMTNLRKLAKSLPCHFALGRNRNHQGLAASIVKLWERSLVAKIAVKRGVQNTNNKLMAEELKKLTGGVLLLRNKYYIVIYRGKDFVPPSVAAALAERQEMNKQIEDAEEKGRIQAADAEEAAVASVEDGEAPALAGTLAEFYEAQAKWGRELSSEEREKMLEAASRTKVTRQVKKLEHKLFIAQSKRLKADKELAKIRESWLPAGPPDDQETVTDEERVMFRRLALRMKPYLPLGIRGVFDGVIENMHLHWKYREVVKLISKQNDLAFVEETARLLEYESGGILIDIVRVPKGYAIIYYRGKNYQRPISIRPRNLPTKARALKRWKALQRYEALSQHVSELETAIEQMKSENGGLVDIENLRTNNSKENDLLDHGLASTQQEDESSWMNSDAEEDDEEDTEWENDDDYDFSSNEDHITSKIKG